MTAPRSPAHLRALREANLTSVLLALTSRPGSRAQLAQRTGLTKATVASLVEPLLAARLLIEDPAEAHGRGRPSHPLRFHPSAPVAIGAEVNVGYIAVATLTLDGRLQHFRRRDVDNRGRPADGLLGELTALAESLYGEAAGPVLGAGLAVPGVVHERQVIRAPNLPQLAGTRPGEHLAAALRLPIVETGNEAGLAARAHLWPVAVTGGDFAYVSGEAGVGAGLVINGEVLHGARGFAGEFGHMVIEREGRPCTCGGRGCVERYAGLRAMLDASGQRDLPSLLDALDSGEAAAVAAARAAGSALGVALASLLNLCDLPAVVLGGVYAQLFAYLRPAVQEELTSRVLADALRPTELRASELGDRAAVQGAAGVITQLACSRPHLLVGGGQPG
ncbi:ROK family protein [Nonomuraea typhae]|uniref:ROK family protein n=1 Tax=Nonomuraea typhae TaxID=2603600 RepID=A0ABW7Z9H2_9ACTN